MLRLLRFLHGSVRFRIEGCFPERFINIALRNGVALWDTRREGDYLYSTMYMRDYPVCRGLSRRCRCRLRIVSRRGLPVVLRRYRGRVGLLIGAGVFAAVVFVMSLFIWNVEIHGLDTVSESVMRETLRKEGVYVGAFKPSLDSLTAARRVMLDLPEVGWMAVNVQGSCADIEVKEEAPAPKVEDITSPANIKASCDGTVVRMNVSRGDAYTTEGSGVVEGQLLVSGVVADKLGGVSLVHADAEIIARTKHSAVFTLKKKESLLLPTGEYTERVRGNILGAECPLSFSAVDSPYFAVRRYRESLLIADRTLPVSIVRERVIAFCDTTIKRKNNSVKELLSVRSLLYTCFALQDCTVESCDTKLSQDKGSYTLKADYTCLEDIALLSPIGTDENTDTRIVREIETESPD